MGVHAQRWRMRRRCGRASCVRCGKRSSCISSAWACASSTMPVYTALPYSSLVLMGCMFTWFMNMWRSASMHCLGHGIPNICMSDTGACDVYLTGHCRGRLASRSSLPFGAHRTAQCGLCAQTALASSCWYSRKSPRRTPSASLCWAFASRTAISLRVCKSLIEILAYVCSCYLEGSDVAAAPLESTGLSWQYPLSGIFIYLFPTQVTPTNGIHMT